MGPPFLVVRVLWLARCARPSIIGWTCANALKFWAFLGWSGGISGCVDRSKKNLETFGFCSALPADLSAR